MQRSADRSGWRVAEKGFQKGRVEALGAKFFMGNGYLGYRGTLEEFSSAERVACTLSGLYDRRGRAWREPVNAPNGLLTVLESGGRPLNPLACRVVSHEQGLDLRRGLHFRRTVFALPGGNRVEVRAERFASLENPHLLCLRYRFKAQGACRLRLSTGIDAAVWDINGPHLARLALSSSAGLLRALATTNEGGRVALAEALEDGPGGLGVVRRGSGILRQGSLRAEAGREYGFTKFVSVFTSLDGVKDPAAAAAADCARAAGRGWDRALEGHTRLWAGRWAESDVAIEGDAPAQEALRYSIYQLLSIAPSHSDRVSIPARGLSGQVYKGAVFWDTEMFMLPFFLNCLPALARNLVKYRCHGLQGARRKAASLGHRGAFYAWESQEGGEEACTLFNITDVFTNRPMRTYFADKQIHISADVAHGIWRYFQLTGDESLLVEGGAEVIWECARFFLSWAHYKADKGRYEPGPWRGWPWRPRASSSGGSPASTPRCCAGWDLKGTWRPSGTSPGASTCRPRTREAGSSSSSTATTAWRTPA